MKPEEYGEKYRDHLLEQYKLFVEMADRVSQRRDQSNRFYVTLVSAIAGLLMVLARFGTSVNGIWPVVFLISGLLGATLSFIWFLNIKSYRTLNTAKFEIINDLERRLPYQGYSKEWELLRPAIGSPKYLQLTRIEQLVPAVIILLFLGIAGYGACLLVRG